MALPEHITNAWLVTEIEDGVPEAVLVVTTDLTTNPTSPTFELDRYNEMITDVVDYFKEHESAYKRIRVVPVGQT